MTGAMENRQPRGTVTVLPPLKPAAPRVLLADAVATLISARKAVNRTPPDVMSIWLGAAIRLIELATKQMEERREG